MYSDNVQISSLTLLDSPSWNVHPVYSRFSSIFPTQLLTTYCLLLTRLHHLFIFFFLNSNWERIDMQQCPHSRPYHHCTSHLSKSDHSDHDDASPYQEKVCFVLLLLFLLFFFFRDFILMFINHQNEQISA